MALQPNSPPDRNPAQLPSTLALAAARRLRASSPDSRVSTQMATADADSPSLPASSTPTPRLARPWSSHSNLSPSSPASASPRSTSRGTSSPKPPPPATVCLCPRSRQVPSSDRRVAAAPAGPQASALRQPAPPGPSPPLCLGHLSRDQSKQQLAGEKVRSLNP